MTPAELDRLAHHLNLEHPDWQIASLRTFAEKHFAQRPYVDVLHAWLDCALDPATKTPARVLGAGPWWKARGVDNEAFYGPTMCTGCGEHGHQRDACPHAPRPADAARRQAAYAAAKGAMERRPQGHVPPRREAA